MFRSAFEHWQPAASPSASSSSAGFEEDDGTKRTRIVGFPESPDFKMQPHELSRFASCSLDERPKRQSSLAQQLALNAFEAEQKPKLRAINTKAKAIGTRRANSTLAAGLGAGYQQQQPTINVHVGNANANTDNNRTSFEFPSTLPSGHGGGYNHHMHHHLNRNSSNSSGSEAVPIPQGLTKAYTAPQPLPELPELSPSLVAIIQGGSSSGATAAKPQPAPNTATVTTSGGVSRRSSHSRLRPSPVSNQHSPPAAIAIPPYSSTSSTPAHSSAQSAAERGALAQVAGLKEALRQQQEEVARLQLELAKLAMHQQASRQQRCGSADVQMTPVTPDAADEHQGEHRHEGKSMSPDDLDTHFEGFNAAGGAAAHHHHWNHDTRGARAWCG